MQEHLMHGYGYLHLEKPPFLPAEQPGCHEGEGVISDHKYSGHNNSVRVEFCSRQRVVSGSVLHVSLTYNVLRHIRPDMSKL